MLITIITAALATPCAVWNCHGTRESKVPLGECQALEDLSGLKNTLISSLHLSHFELGGGK